MAEVAVQDKIHKDVCTCEAMWDSLDGSKCRYIHGETNHLKFTFRYDKHITI
jgi:hypothetical protein